MFLNNLNKLKNKNIFISQKDLSKNHYEKIKVILKNFYSIKINKTKLSSKDTFLFFNPINYYKYKSKKKILLTLNFDDLDGKIENLYLLNKVGLINKNYKDEIFLRKFQKFLEAKSKSRKKLFRRFKKKINLLNYFLLKINLRLSKYYIYDKYYIPYLKIAGSFKEIVYGRNIFSFSTYNVFYSKNSDFLKLYSYNLKKLSDKVSREIYKTVIFGNPIKIWRMFVSNIFKPNQYFDHIKLNKNSVVINCGVYRGHEIPEYLSYNIKKIYNIDPAGASYLHPYVKNYIRKFKNKIIFIKKALYTSGTVWDRNNNSKDVNVTTLSKIVDSLKLKKIDLIKTDIEGAERMLVYDLDQIIKKYRPQLSISIYHFDHRKNNLSNDLVLIPNVLIKICNNYKFYIKHYSFDRRETIIYCIPY